MKLRTILTTACLLLTVLGCQARAYAQPDLDCEGALAAIQTQWEEGDLLAALTTATVAIDPDEMPGDICVPTLYTWQAALYAALQELTPAEQSYQVALDRWRQLLSADPSPNTRLATAATANNLGLVLARLGRYQAALATLHESLNLLASAPRLSPSSRVSATPTRIVRLPSLRDLEDPDLVAQQRTAVMNNIGLVYLNLSDYERANEYFDDALRNATLPEQRAQALNHKALVARSQGDYSAALDFLVDAEAALPAQNQVAGVIWSNRGATYTAQGRYAEAIAVYQQALDFQGVATEQEPAQFLFQFSAGWGRARRVTDGTVGRYETVTIINRATELAARATINHNIGNAYRLQGDLVQASAYFSKSLVQAEQAGNINGMVSTLHALALTQEAAGATEQAMATRYQALARLESLGSLLAIPELQSAYNAKQAPLYADLVRLLAASGRSEDAFLISERARARAFLNQIGNQVVDMGQTVAPQLAAQLQTVRQQINGLQLTLTAERAKSPPDATLIADLSTQLEAARHTYETLLTQLQLLNPEYASLLHVDVLAPDAVQTQVLDAQTTLIVYFVLEDTTLAWVIEPDGFTLVPLDAGRAELTESIEFFRNLIISERDFDVETAVSLYTTLIAPLKPHIHHDNLVIVPHGVLHYLPFAALWNETAARYLVQEYTLTYAPSATTLKFIQAKRNPNNARLLALGNPDGTLSNAQAEAQSIANLYMAQALTGAAATESQVYANAQAVDLLHLAAHGRYDAFNALFSRIELAADAANDGHLEVHEVFNLRLARTNLVVLSACDTSAGEINQGDEIVGLTRAFLYAGAPTVMTTLWPIDDETSAPLMVSFYQHLRAGQTVATALRLAQIEALARANKNSPYYWAAFMLTGDYQGSNSPP